MLPDLTDAAVVDSATLLFRQGLEQLSVPQTAIEADHAS
jgi:hypothetical protein